VRLAERPTLALCLLLAVSAALRLIALPAFPEVVADEGLWTNSSKNFVAFGDWFMDGRTHLFLSPVFHGLSVGIFEIFGPSIAAARVISGAAGTISVLLLYLLVLRVTARVDLAFVSGTLLGVTADFVFHSRLAIIESLQLCFLLSSALALSRGGTGGAVTGGLAFALALLTKLNSAWFGVVLPFFLLGSSRPRAVMRDPVWLGRCLLFGAVAIGSAAAVYAALYHYHPDRFVAAFRFELDGLHFAGLSRPIVQFGRFGIDPVQAARTLLGLFRESPFLMVLATLGGVFAVMLRYSPALAFAVWALFGSGFALMQIYQPPRYFHAMAPAYCFFAAVAVLAWRDGAAVTKQRFLGAVLGVYVAFNLSYLALNAVANPARMVDSVTRWARENTRPSDNILAAGYLCTDLPNRAYARYHLGADITQLAASIDRYEIAYVIADRSEWSSALRDALAARYEKVQEWPFGQVFRVRPELEPASGDGPQPAQP
jgi:hypothetical protein